jgi:hypothetical protein
MTATIRKLVTEYNLALGEGRLHRVAELLHPDLVSGGATATEIRGAAPYVAALRKLAPVVVRNDIREIVVDGGQAFVLYDFVTDTAAGAVLSGELVRIEDGLIRSITLIFDWRRWPEVLQEVARRAAAPAEANR